LTQFARAGFAEGSSLLKSIFALVSIPRTRPAFDPADSRAARA